MEDNPVPVARPDFLNKVFKNSPVGSGFAKVKQIQSVIE